MTEPKLSKDEEKWQARDDAYTLQMAEVIRNDSKRLERAMKEAKKIAEEKKKEAKAIAKVAKGQLYYKSMVKEK